jgi:aspartokinase/homoserine dehydrogenase 1
MSIVLKFGGTSLQNTQRIVEAAHRIQSHATEEPIIVVASAMGGITRLLRQLAGLQPPEHKQKIALSLIRQQHWNVLGDLNAMETETHAELRQLFAELEQHLQQPQRTGSPNAWTDHLLGFGERASVRLLSFALRQLDAPARFYESDRFIKTDDRHGSARILDDQSTKLVQQYLGNISDHIPVITGFIGRSLDDQPTTLGRSGSDYTASWLASRLQASTLEFWTDVDGIHTADPARISGTQSIPQLSYRQLHHLTAAGSNAIHPAVLEPLREHQPKVRIRNSFNADHPGTLIHTQTESSEDLQFSLTRQEVKVLRFRSTYRTAPRILGDHLPLLYHRVTPASSDFQHTLVYPSADLDALFPHLDALRALSIEPAVALRVLVLSGTIPAARQHHLRRSLWDHLTLSDDRMESDTSHLYIIGTERADCVEQSVHDILRYGQPKIPVFLAGLGSIGSELIRQLADHSLRNHFQIVGVCNSTHHWWDPAGIAPAQLTAERLKQQEPYASTDTLKRLLERAMPGTCLIDTTGDPTIAAWYPDLIERGFHIITPSKHAGAAERSQYQRLQNVLAQQEAFFGDETTVGAGLPLLQTIDRLRETGDTIRKLEIIASGSLNFILSRMEEGVMLSEAVAEAQDRGLTEPDPSEDLSGQDVARKARILARRAGWEIPESAIYVVPLVKLETKAAQVPAPLRLAQNVDHFHKTLLTLSRASARDKHSMVNEIGSAQNPSRADSLHQDSDIDDSLSRADARDRVIRNWVIRNRDARDRELGFMDRLRLLDKEWQGRIRQAQAEGKVLRYVGTIEDHRIDVGLRTLPRNHELAQTGGTQNTFIIYTDHYQDEPLIIKGPGAGVKVTAAGVLGDLMRLYQDLTA